MKQLFLLLVLLTACSPKIEIELKESAIAPLPTPVPEPEEEVEVFFNPLSIPNGILWLDSNDLSTYTVSAGVLTSWRDKSGNSHNFITSSNCTGPSIDSTSFARPSMDFNGGFKCLKSLTDVIVSPAYTTFIVGNWIHLNNYNSLGPFGGDTSDVFSGNNHTGYIVYYSGVGSAGLGISFAPEYGYRRHVDFEATGKFLFTASATGTPSDQYFRFNGTEYLPQFTNNTSGLVLNTVGSADADYASNGSIAEVIIFNRTLSPTEVSQIETYLKDKWNLP